MCLFPNVPPRVLIQPYFCFSHSLLVFPLWDVLRDQPIPHSAVLHVVLYMLYACMPYSRWAAGLIDVCHVGQLYTYLRRWKFWTIVWENTNGVHFRAVWKNTAHVQGIRCSPKGSHLIPWTNTVFSKPHSNEHRLHILSVHCALFLFVCTVRLIIFNLSIVSYLQLSVDCAFFMYI